MSSVQDADAVKPGQEGIHADAWLDAITWDDRGLVPAIAQDHASGRVLMMAWMSRETLAESLRVGHAVYWSRSRSRPWRKGEVSGHVQKLVSLRLDCDGDCLLLTVEQVGGVACHTGRESCFFSRLLEVGERRWEPVDPVLKDPATLYGA